jgi:hypothetical protein
MRTLNHVCQFIGAMKSICLTAAGDESSVAGAKKSFQEVAK